MPPPKLIAIELMAEARGSKSPPPIAPAPLPIPIIGLIPPMPPVIMVRYIWPAKAASRSAEPTPKPPLEAFALPPSRGDCVAPTANSL